MQNISAMTIFIRHRSDESENVQKNEQKAISELYGCRFQVLFIALVAPALNDYFTFKGCVAFR